MIICETPGVYEDFYHPALTGNSLRSKRQTFGFNFNDDHSQFYAGLELDGFMEYNNLSTTFEDMGQFIIYIDPYLEEFPGGVFEFDESHEDSLISIWVSIHVQRKWYVAIYT